ncbi:hypothetical protein EDD17DRAFT_1764749 [Pisolithus thermaeus]|nr:hypothetical protein EDD17DRAFT_1764749 [Pisolithus thermaeus]
MSFGDGHMFALPTRSYHPHWARPHPKNLHIPSSPALSPQGRSYHPTHTLKIYKYLHHLPCRFELNTNTPPVLSSPAVSPQGRSHHPPPKFKNLPGPTTPHPHLKIYEVCRTAPCPQLNTNTPSIPSSPAMSPQTSTLIHPPVPSSPAVLPRGRPYPPSHLCFEKVTSTFVISPLPQGRSYPHQSLKKFTSTFITCPVAPKVGPTPPPPEFQKNYKGFYSEGIPILAHPPVVQGSFQHAISSQVASLPTALVHLHMDNLEVGHAQVNIMNSYLQPYFPQGSYQFSQLPFNLATQESLHDYEKAAIDLAHSLSSFSRVVLFLTTHSDEERGDLFSGEVDGKPIASKVSECLQVLFHPLTKIVKGADVIFNVCGSVVTVQDSFDDLKEAAHK